MPADYYKILGVDKSASADEIKRAYRKLAHEYHPDKKDGNEQKFKEINEAYQILSDPGKRSRYDQFGSAGFQQGFGGPFDGAQGGRGFDGFDFSDFGFGRGGTFDMNDIFDMFGGGIFGGRRARRAEAELNRGADIETNLDIDFRDSIRGGVKKIEITKDQPCPNCHGTGVKAGAGTVECSVCRGTGEIKETVSSFFGNMTRIYACKACKGAGKVPKENCPACLGEGRAKSKKILDVNIPGGVKNGEVLAVRGQGQAGFRGGQAGDLFLRLRVIPDKRFRRVDDDLVYNLNIKVTDALLGKTIQVPTLDGDKGIEIPAGVEDGQELRLKGLGVHGYRKGDQIIKIKIKIPRKLSARAKKLVDELSAEI